MAKLFIEDLDLGGKRVIMRVDFNVPLKDGNVENDKRLRAALPSIKYVLDQGASLVLMSHLGRPNGKASDTLSLAPVAERLSELLGKPVRFCPKTVGDEVDPFYGYYTLHTLNDGEIEGMLSVNGTTGQVWYHSWHGDFLDMTEDAHD